jgi:hypothetical protein
MMSSRQMTGHCLSHNSDCDRNSASIRVITTTPNTSENPRGPEIATVSELTATVTYTIGYGRPSASHEDIVAAAGAPRGHDFIRPLPMAMNPCGERGLKLSEGENSVWPSLVRC